MTIDDGELSGCQGDPCIQGKVENTETCHLGDRLLTPQAACLQLGGGSRRVIMCRWQLPPLRPDMIAPASSSSGARWPAPNRPADPRD